MLRFYLNGRRLALITGTCVSLHLQYICKTDERRDAYAAFRGLYCSDKFMLICTWNRVFDRHKKDRKIAAPVLVAGYF